MQYIIKSRIYTLDQLVNFAQTLKRYMSQTAFKRNFIVAERMSEITFKKIASVLTTESEVILAELLQLFAEKI